MGMIICPRCDAPKDSKDGDTVVDPSDECQMICEDCLTDAETEQLEAAEWAEMALARRDMDNQTPEYLEWRKKHNEPT